MLIGVYLGRLISSDDNSPLVFTYVLDHVDFLLEEIIGPTEDANSAREEYFERYVNEHHDDVEPLVSFRNVSVLYNV